MDDPNIHLSDTDLLVGGVSLDFNAFKIFYEKRRGALKDRLISRVYMTGSLSTEIETEDSDEEVVEEMIA